MYVRQKPSTLQNLEYLEKWWCITKCVQRGRVVVVVYVAPFFTWKSVCGIFRTWFLLSKISDIWIKVTYWVAVIMKKRWVQIVNSMSGVCKKMIGQWHSTEAEDELQVIPCMGFYAWAYSAHCSSVSERYFGCRASAVLLHNYLLNFQPQNAEKKSFIQKLTK